jgi:hypothetical protein
MLMSIVVRVYPHEKPTIRFIPKLTSKELLFFFFFFFFFFFDMVKSPDQSIQHKNHQIHLQTGEIKGTLTLLLLLLPPHEILIIST